MVDISQEEREALYEREQRAAAAAGIDGSGERRICRNVPHDSNTRVGRQRLCLTARQWRARQ